MLIRFRLAKSIGRWAYVRGLTDVPSKLRERLMNDFTLFLSKSALHKSDSAHITGHSMIFALKM